MSIKKLVEFIENEVCYYKNKLINSYRCNSELGIIVKVTGGEYSINYDDINITDFKTKADILNELASILNTNACLYNDRLITNYRMDQLMYIEFEYGNNIYFNDQSLCELIDGLTIITPSYFDGEGNGHKLDCIKAYMTMLMNTNDVVFYRHTLIKTYQFQENDILINDIEYIQLNSYTIQFFKNIEDVKSLYHEKFRERNFRGNHILDYYFTNDKYPNLSVTVKYNDTIRGNIIICADLLSEYFKDHSENEIKRKFHAYFKNGMFRKHKLISYHFTPNTNTLIITTNITQYAIPYYELESLYEQITNECRDSELEKIYTNRVDVIENMEESSKPVIGYHMTEIEKGELGNLSKIREELDEAIDAEKQQCKIMTLVELSDMMGAIESYLESNFADITLQDLITMSDITKRAFKAGRR